MAAKNFVYCCPLRTAPDKRSDNQVKVPRTTKEEERKGEKSLLFMYIVNGGVTHS